jgi:hypothetical protein
MPDPGKLTVGEEHARDEIASDTIPVFRVKMTSRRGCEAISTAQRAL